MRDWKKAQRLGWLPNNTFSKGPHHCRSWAKEVGGLSSCFSLMRAVLVAAVDDME